VDDGSGDVHRSRLLESDEAGRRVDLAHHRAGGALQEVDTGDPQTHGDCGLRSETLVGVVQRNLGGLGAAGAVAFPRR